MAGSAGGLDTNRERENHGDLLPYAFDAGYLTGDPPPDTPRTGDADDGGDSLAPESSDLGSSDSGAESKWRCDLASSVRLFSRSLLRIDLAEMKMMKEREASRVEAERRRVELEMEMTRMLSNTQLQIASFLSRTSRDRKRKRVEDEDHSSSERRVVMLLGLLQSNLSFSV